MTHRNSTTNLCICSFLFLSLLLISGCTHLSTPSNAHDLPAPRRTPSLPAGDAISLEEAVILALENNPDLRIQRFEPPIAGTFLAREQARFSPEIFAEASLRESRSSETARATGEQFDAEVSQTRAQAGIRQSLASGSDVELSAGQFSESSNRSPDQEEVRVTLSLTQSLLRGRQREANLVGVRLAELGLEISAEELRGFTEALVADVEQAYWHFWLATETIAIAEQALNVSEKQLADIRQRIEVGQLARNEDAPARAEVARRRQVLIDARADLFRARLDLMARVSPGISPDQVPTLAASGPEMPDPETDTTAEDRIQLALNARPDLREARMRFAQRSLDTLQARDGLLPRLDFFADLAKTGFGPTAGDAWSDLTEDNYDAQAGIRFLRPLGGRPEVARESETRFREAQAETALKNLERRIHTEVHLALNELDRALRQVEASAETRYLQELTVASEVERFEVGAVTALQVAQAQRDLLSAMIDEQAAKVQARIALLELYKTEGSLLERRGIGQ